MRILIALVLVAFLVIPATAGDCGSGCGGKKGCSPCGFKCKTECPIAQQANDCRSFGTEADDTSDTVEDNLSKI